MGINLKNLFNGDIIGDLLKSALPGSISGLVDIFRKKGDNKTADNIENTFSSEEFRLEYEKLLLDKIQHSNEFSLKLKEFELREKEAELKDLASAREFANNDNINGNKLARNVRPITAFLFIGIFLFCVSLIVIAGITIIFVDGIEISAMESLINLSDKILSYINVPLISILGLYFGARSYEKTQLIPKNTNKESELK